MSAIIVSAVFLRTRYLCSLRACGRRREYRGYGRELFVKCLTKIGFLSVLADQFDHSLLQQHGLI